MSSNGIIANIINTGTTTLTGDIIATLLLVFAFIIIIALMFGIPLEFIAVLILPLSLVLGAYYSIFWLPVFIIIVFVASIITKNWLFR